MRMNRSEIHKCPKQNKIYPAVPFVLALALLNALVCKGGTSNYK